MSRMGATFPRDWPSVYVLMAVTPLGCGASSGSAIDASMPSAAAVFRDAQNVDPEAEGGAATQDAPAAERACGLAVYNPVLVCFGADPAPYVRFLSGDAGVGVGQCPTTAHFRQSPAEGACGYSVCGPLAGDAIPADAAPEAGAPSCCFWAVETCGV